MTGPVSRAELVNGLASAYKRLQDELSGAGVSIAKRVCVDDWTVKDLLAVRVWWTASVCHWIEAGKQGNDFTVPAAGYRWRDTPRLNADIIRDSQKQTYAQVRRQLEKNVGQVFQVVATLDDTQLLGSGVFSWAGNYPVSRWLSINTTRQYTTARTYIRRMLREHNITG